MNVKPLILIALLFLVTVPAVYAGEMEDFFDILIYGEASWLFLLIFMGLGFVITWKVRSFGLICFVACLYQAMQYITQPNQVDFMWNIVLLMLGMIMFLLKLGKVELF